jgi:hypothetical protein
MFVAFVADLVPSLLTAICCQHHRPLMESKTPCQIMAVQLLYGCVTLRPHQETLSGREIVLSPERFSENEDICGMSHHFASYVLRH